jgi:hypothetical protein
MVQLLSECEHLHRFERAIISFGNFAVPANPRFVDTETVGKIKKMM